MKDEHEGALARLPENYAAALRMRARGLTEQAIAAELKLEPEAVGPLLRLAEAKLSALLAIPSQKIQGERRRHQVREQARTAQRHRSKEEP